jgi:hypothetical protein
VLRRRSFGSSASILALFRPMGVPANSDYYPLVEQRTSRSRFTQESVTDLLEMQGSDMPLLEMLDGTFHPADHPVDAIASTLPERAAIDAWGFHRVLLDPAWVPPGPLPSSNSREYAARLISTWATACPASTHFERLLPSMVWMAQTINPHVDRKSALQVWRFLGDSACGRRLAPQERHWLDLFAAVAGRDAGGMSRIGLEILEANRHRRDAATEYAFEAAATGLVCQHRMAEANRLFEQGTRDWLLAGKAPIALRYLYALSSLPPGASSPDGADCQPGASSPPALTSPATRSPSPAARSTGR